MQLNENLFDGKIGRIKFIYYTLILGLLSLMLYYFNEKASEYTEILTGMAIIFFGVIGLTIIVKRLRDAGLSFWWLLLYLIPPIGLMVTVVLFFKPSK